MKGKSLYLAIRAAATVSAMLGTLVMPAAMHAAARSGDNDNSSSHAWTAGYSESNWSNMPNGFGFNASSDEDVDHSEDADNNSDTDADENADDPGDDQQGDDQGATGADNGTTTRAARRPGQRRRQWAATRAVGDQGDNAWRPGRPTR